MIDKESIKVFFQDIRSVTSESNDACLYDNCPNAPAKSHVISRQTLKMIADDNGKVLTWHPSVDEMIGNHYKGRKMEEIYKEPTFVSLREKGRVTRPLFCPQHDKSIFCELEDKNFSATLAQITLLGYRALCSMTFQNKKIIHEILNLSRKYKYKHSLDTPENLQKINRLMAQDVLIKTREVYETMYKKQDYSRLKYISLIISIPPCVASTYSLTPGYPHENNSLIQGTRTLTENDVVCFSLLPFAKLDSSLCVISWLGNNEKPCQIFNLDDMSTSDREQQDLLFYYAFQSPTIFISPKWWSLLSQKEKDHFVDLHLAPTGLYSLLYR